MSIGISIKLTVIFIIIEFEEAVSYIKSIICFLLTMYTGYKKK